MLEILPAICIAFGVASTLLSIRRRLIINGLIQQSNNHNLQGHRFSLLNHLLSLDVCLIAAFSTSFFIISYMFKIDFKLFPIIISIVVYLILLTLINSLKKEFLRFLGKRILLVLICIFFVLLSDLHLINLGGLLGIYRLNNYESAFISIAICLITVISFINISRNTYFFHPFATYISLSLAIIFLLVGQSQLSLISFILTAAMFGFLRQDILYANNIRANVLIVFGLFVSYQIISFLNIIQESNVNQYFSNPSILFAVLIIPFSELLKAAVVGYLNKVWSLSNSNSIMNVQPVSFFQKFLLIGISPRKSVRSIIAINLLIVLFTIGFHSVSPLILFLFIISFIVIINLLLDIRIKRVAYSNINRKNVSFVEELNVTSSEN